MPESVDDAALVGDVERGVDPPDPDAEPDRGAQLDDLGVRLTACVELAATFEVVE